MAHGFEQQACAVKVNAIALIEIDLRLGRDDSGEMKDDGWSFSDKFLRLARSGEIGG